MANFNIKNRQVRGSGHTRETSSKSSIQGPVITNTGSLAFIEENKEEIGKSIARFRSSKLAKKSRKSHTDSHKAQKDYVQQIKKIPDLDESGLKKLAQDLLASEKDLREVEISARLKKQGFTDHSHVYLALRFAKDAMVSDLNKFSFSQNLQAIELYTSRIEAIESYIQNHMERHGEEIFAGINSGQEQLEFSKLGLGTPQILRDYYRSVIKEHKSVLDIYKDVIAKHGIKNFDTRCDFLMKFVSRHLQGVKGRYDSTKLQLMHKEIHLLRSVQTGIAGVASYFNQYNTKRDPLQFQHKVFEQVVGMVETTSVREAQIAGLNTLCGVSEFKEKISVVNNLIACVSDMPDMMFSNITARIKLRMMIYSISEKLMAAGKETREEFAKSILYFKAGGFLSDAADPALDSLKIAAYYPERNQHDDAGEVLSNISYEFKLIDDVRPKTLSDFKGKTILAVNIASGCGFTQQLESLEALYKEFKDQDFIILGFPSNSFFQEPLENEKIISFCQDNFEVSFPLTEKTPIIGGEAHPFFKKLASDTGQVPDWNFYKYLISPEGHTIDVFPSTVTPDSKVLRQAIARAMKTFD